jgi:hypothetical protein
MFRGKLCRMDKKTPTIEALEAALSAHYEALTKEDRIEQITWFLDAIDEAKLLYREITATIEEMVEDCDTDKDAFSIPPEHLARWIMEISAKFFFIGWNVRGAIEDDDKLQNLH